MSPQPQPQPQGSGSGSGSGLNVIALVSGGKDSLYSILHCIRNGHTVVALANLYPKPGPGGDDDDDEEDTDSFMYQTIGHSVIPLYEVALGIPLYRGHIVGGAVDTSRVYRDTASSSRSSSSLTSSDENQDQDSGQDETESLTPLLKRIMAKHPDANAVSAGAILSTYQRTRIENVAGRLGLTPLAWLWMYPALPAAVERQRGDVAGASLSDAGLLEDMAAVGCEARIIKVASGGLDEGVLWEDVSGSGPGTGASVRGKLVKAMKRFCAPEDIRGAVLGEGGEYESLALDGPGFLWKKRIVIEEREGRTGEGGVGFMRLKGAKCVVKEKDEGVEDVMPEDVRRPALLDGVFGEVLDGLLAAPVHEEGGLSTELKDPEKQWLHCEPTQTKDAGIWTISNLTAPEAGPDSGAQMQAITEKVKTILSQDDTTPRSTDDIVFTTVLLRSMTDFTHMNNIYNTLFRKPNPPARATIACGETLPEGVNIMVSFVVDLGPRDARQGLHVQSRSYWAPANIGPYSQAMSIPLQTDAGRLVYIAGQIPLEPASMELVSPALASALGSASLVTEQPGWMAEYTLRTVLALQHLWRIGSAMQVDWWVGAVAYLTGEDDGHVDTKARIAWRLWEKMHTQTDNDDDEEDEDEEPAFDAWDLKYGHQAYEQLSSSAETPSLPNFNVLQQSSITVPPFFAAQVAELPRGSDIEWHGLGSHCDQVVISPPGTTGTTTTTTINKNLRYTGVEISIEQSRSELEACLQKVLETHGQQNVSQIVVYTAETLSPGFVWPGQIVPCRGVWGMQGRRLRAGVVIQSVDDSL